MYSCSCSGGGVVLEPLLSLSLLTKAHLHLSCLTINIIYFLQSSIKCSISNNKDIYDQTRRHAHLHYSFRSFNCINMLMAAITNSNKYQRWITQIILRGEKNGRIMQACHFIRLLKLGGGLSRIGGMGNDNHGETMLYIIRQNKAFMTVKTRRIRILE